MQRNVPYNRRNADDIKRLTQALEASGGVLPPEKMPQELSNQAISSLAKTVSETADPVKGELVFRKSNLSCLTCHAIGGAGGRLGPDLSSLGTSSPPETIIRSILYPNQSIKEGFELQRVVKKDGNELMGYLVGTGNSELVLRDASGAEVSVPKSQINRVEKVPGSLMPSGLTAALTQDEFVNLVGFLSKMGEPGKFRVPTVRFVRRWLTLSASKELARKISTGGPGYILKDNAKVAWQPVYSKVAGDLLLDELPVIDVNASKRYSFVRFDIEVVSQGNVYLAMNSTAGLSSWIDTKSVKITGHGLLSDLPSGLHSITVAIDRTQRQDDSFSIQLQDADASPAQTRLVIGR